MSTVLGTDPAAGHTLPYGDCLLSQPKFWFRASGSAPRLPPSASKELQNIGGIDMGAGLGAATAQAGGFGAF